MIIIELFNYLPVEYFSPVDRFVYMYRPVTETQASFWTDTFGAPDETGDERIYIGDLVRNAIEAVYDSVDTYNDCFNDEKSFFWDQDNQILYVHFEHSESWYTAPFAYGRAFGYNEADPIYIDDAEYLPLLNSVPGIQQQEDVRDYKSLAFISGSIALNSQGGEIDWMIDANNYGQPIYMYYLDNADIVQGSATRSDLVELAAFYIQDYRLGVNENIIQVQDIRKSQNIDIPVDKFTTADYPGIDTDYVNKPVPLLYGSIAEAEAIPVSSESPGNVTFVLAKTLTVLGQVQIFENDVWSDVETITEDLINGSFVLNYTDCRKDDELTGDVLRCRVLSATGEAVTYASDVIKYLNFETLGIEYNSSNYNTTEWEAEETDLSAIGVLFNEEIKLFDAIRQIQQGANIRFRYEIKPDGGRTIRINDYSRTSAYTVNGEDIRNRLLIKVFTNSKLVAGVVSVDYKKNYESGDYRTYIDDSKKPDVLAAYRQAPTMKIKSLLQTSALAAERATNEINIFSEIPRTASVELIGPSWYTLRIYDVITIELTPGDVDLDAGTITGREFFGVWKAQVVSVNPRFAELTNQIKIVLIEKII